MELSLAHLEPQEGFFEVVNKALDSFKYRAAPLFSAYGLLI